MTQEQKHYYAFISYKREDKKEAKRLQHTLEYYKLPNKLRQENPELPEFVRPIFRDMTDLEVGELSAQIHEALDQSHFLIVICSPRAAKSKWVNDEIEYFISIGKQEKIIPYIIEGLPYAENPEEECYPPALLALSKEKELLGANINEVGKDSAAIRVVSRMFNIRFDTLYQRYQREKRRKLRGIFTLILFILFLLLSFIAYVLYSNNSLKEKNFLIEQQNTTLENQKNDLEKSRDSIIATSTKLEISNKNLSVARDSLVQSNNYLLRANELLKEEQEKVKRENWKMMENQARSVAANASECLKNGDSYTATLLALSVLPSDIKQPNRPWTLEADSVLRQAALIKNGYVLRGCGFVTSVAFSPDGQLLASGSLEKNIYLWNFKTGEQIGILQGHTSYVQSVCFCPDGKYLVSASSDSTIRVWDVRKKSCIKVLRGHKDNISSVKYCPDGQIIASASGDGTIRLWDAESGMCTCVLQGHTNKVKSLAFSPNGKYIVSASDDETVRIWDVATGENTNTLFGHSYWVNEVDISYDGKYISSCSYDTTIRVWDFQTGKEIYVLKQLEPAYNIAFDRTKNVLAFGGGKDIQTFDVDAGIYIRTLHGHTESISAIEYSKDGNMIASASQSEGRIRIWDNSPKCTTPHTHQYTNYVNAAILNSTGDRVAFAQFNHIIRLWNATNGDSIRTLCGHTNWVTSVDFNPVGNLLVSASWDGTIRLWNATNGDSIRTIRGHNSWVNSVAFSPNGKYIVSASLDKTTRIWDVETGKNIHTLRGHTKGVSRAIFALNNENVVSMAEDNSIRVWNIQDGTSNTCMTLPCQVYSFDISPDGKYIVTSSWDNVIRLWDITTGSIIREIGGHDKYAAEYITFSPDGRFLISARSQDRTVRIWDVETGKNIHTLRGHTRPVFNIAISPDSKRVASASSDNTIRIWDMETGEMLGMIHENKVSYLSFAHDNQQIIAGIYDGSMRTWYFPPIQNVINEASERYKGRTLTPEERRKYYLE